MSPLLFNSSFGLKLNVPDVVREIVRFIKDEPKRSYKVIIGTDSEQIGVRDADFVTAVVVHRLGNCGIGLSAK